MNTGVGARCSKRTTSSVSASSGDGSATTPEVGLSEDGRGSMVVDGCPPVVDVDDGLLRVDDVDLRPLDIVADGRLDVLEDGRLDVLEDGRLDVLEDGRLDVLEDGRLDVLEDDRLDDAV